MAFDKELTASTRKYSNLRCDICDKKLINDSDSDNQCLQPKHSLILRLEGGYGMAFDQVGDEEENDLVLLFCQGCVKSIPLIKAKVDKLNGKA
jgi:hypothetical protein